MQVGPHIAHGGLSAVCSLLYAVCCLLSAVCCLLSDLVAVFFHCLLSDIADVYLSYVYLSDIAAGFTRVSVQSQQRM